MNYAGRFLPHFAALTSSSGRSEETAPIATLSELFFLPPDFIDQISLFSMTLPASPSSSLFLSLPMELKRMSFGSAFFDLSTFLPTSVFLPGHLARSNVPFPLFPLTNERLIYLRAVGSLIPIRCLFSFPKYLWTLIWLL